LPTKKREQQGAGNVSAGKWGVGGFIGSEKENREIGNPRVWKRERRSAGKPLAGGLRGGKTSRKSKGKERKRKKGGERGSSAIFCVPEKRRRTGRRPIRAARGKKKTHLFDPASAAEGERKKGSGSGPQQQRGKKGEGRKCPVAIYDPLPKRKKKKGKRKGPSFQAEQKKRGGREGRLPFHSKEKEKKKKKKKTQPSGPMLGEKKKKGGGGKKKMPPRFLITRRKEKKKGTRDLRKAIWKRGKEGRVLLFSAEGGKKKKKDLNPRLMDEHSGKGRKGEKPRLLRVSVGGGRKKKNWKIRVRPRQQIWQGDRCSYGGWE